MNVLIKLKKHKNRILSVFCSLLLIPCFSIHSSAVDFFYNSIMPDVISCGLLSNVSLNTKYPTPNYGFAFEFENTGNSNVTQLMPTFQTTWDVMWDTENYDYYLSFYLDSQSPSFLFRPDKIYLRYFNNAEDYVNLPITDFKVYPYYGADINTRTRGFRVLAKVPDNFNYPIRAIDMRDSDGGSVSPNVRFAIAIVQTSKNTSLDSLNSIVQAINNQTGVMEEKFDETNDLITDGDENTQSAVNDFEAVFSEFNYRVDMIEQFEADTVEEFTNANTEYLTQLNNFSLSGSLLSAGNWLSTSMETVYNNSSDYKMLWLVPLLFGIPILLFVVRKSGDDD